jgi:hypothetical protein
MLGSTAMDTNLVHFTLRRVGSTLHFAADPVKSGSQSFVMHSLQLQRLPSEYDALRALELAGIGRWSSFPPDGIEATVTRDQLRAMGFRGNY